MKNHYNTLGVTRSASKETIRAAYKRLALIYHPDRNPNNAAAEEKFKDINEAYQILGDTARKEKYDILLDFHLFRKQPQVTMPRYQPYTYRRQPPRPRYTDYKFDRTYFKHQAIAILIVLFISSVVIAVDHFNSYMKVKEREEMRMENQKILSAAQGKFSMGDFYGAIDMIQQLAKAHPTDVELDLEKEKMIEELYQKARRQYAIGDYSKAIFNLLTVKEFQHPQNLEVYDYLARCYIETKDFENAAASYEYVFLREPHNIQLAVNIALLYHYNIKNSQKALVYYDKAKALFKRRQSQLYGEAFELLMDPVTTPDLYFEIFISRAQFNFDSGDYHTAITDCNWAAFLRPDQAEPYLIRASSYLKTNNPEKACKDYNKALTLGYSADPAFDLCRTIF